MKKWMTIARIVLAVLGAAIIITALNNLNTTGTVFGIALVALSSFVKDINNSFK